MRGEGATFARVALPLAHTCTFKPPCPPPLKKTLDSKKLENIRENEILRNEERQNLDSKLQTDSESALDSILLGFCVADSVDSLGLRFCRCVFL